MMDNEFRIVCRTTFWLLGHTDRHETFIRTARFVVTTAKADSVSPASTVNITVKIYDEEYPVLGFDEGLDAHVVAILTVMDGVRRKLYTDILLPGVECCDMSFLQRYADGEFASKVCY